MVTLKKLGMHGFKQFSEPTEFSFADGINVISGPNEAGKSTILDAVIAAIFGATPSEVAPLQSWSNPDACMVRLEYEVEGVGYAIERFLADGKATLYKDEGKGYTKVTTTKSKIEDAIDRHFGFREKRVFENTLVIRQNDIAFLPDKKGKDKTAFDKLKMMIDRATSGADDTDTALSSIISDVKKKAHELRTPRGKGALDELDVRIQKSEEELRLAKQKMGAIDGDRRHLDKLTQEIETSSTRLTTLKDRREIHGARTRIEERRSEIAARDKAIQDILEKVSEANTAVQKASGEAAPLEKKYGSITEEASAVIPTLSENIKSSEGRISELGKKLEADERRLEIEHEKLVQYPGIESLSDDELQRALTDIDIRKRVSGSVGQASSSEPGTASRTSPMVPFIAFMLTAAAGHVTGNLIAGLVGGVVLALIVYLALGHQAPTTSVTGSTVEKAELERRFAEMGAKVPAFNPDTFPTVIKRYRELTASIDTLQHDVDKVKEDIEKEKGIRQSAVNELEPVTTKVPGFTYEQFSKEYPKLMELRKQQDAKKEGRT